MKILGHPGHSFPNKISPSTGPVQFFRAEEAFWREGETSSRKKKTTDKVQLTQKSYLVFSLFVVQDRWIHQNFIVCSVLTVFTRYTRLRSFLYVEPQTLYLLKIIYATLLKVNK